MPAGTTVAGARTAPPLTLAVVEALLDRRRPRCRSRRPLARITALLDLLGNPQRAYPVIQIAGTNGKTSTARMIDALLDPDRACAPAGSPPRTCSWSPSGSALDGAPISAEQYVAVLHRHRAVHRPGRRGRRRGTAALPLSKFEILTAMAYRRVRRRPGGRRGHRGRAGRHLGLHQRGRRQDRGDHPDRHRPHRVPRRHARPRSPATRPGSSRPTAIAVIGPQEPEAMNAHAAPDHRGRRLRSPGSAASSPCWTGLSRSAGSG